MRGCGLQTQHAGHRDGETRLEGWRGAGEGTGEDATVLSHQSIGTTTNTSVGMALAISEGRLEAPQIR